jgi:hypothetical protein
LSNRLAKRRAHAAAGHEVGPPLPRLREVYLAASTIVRDPQTGERIAARPLGGPTLGLHEAAWSSANSSPDLRLALMDWLTDPENPYFARNIVNRVWAHYFGRGLLEPLDGFSAANPPSHPELFDELAEDFVTNGYDIRRLERLILNSATWQLSSEPNSTNTRDNRHLARAYVRLPPPETIVDMWHAATGVAADFGDSVPNEIRAVEIGPDRLGDERWDRFFQTFGRSTRTQTCDCEATQTPSIRQTLALMCDPHLLAELPNGRLKTLLDNGLDDDELLDELFLNTLSRWPNADEREATKQHIETSADRNQVFEDVLWALLNTQEFITNH